MSRPQGFILYRIYYGSDIIYLGRTKQPLQDRIRGHLFQKPMHRNIGIELVSRIEYAEFKTEADMNVYEVYFINLYRPPLNRDDKAKDELTIALPEVEWKLFTTPLWDEWKKRIAAADAADAAAKKTKIALELQKREMRRKYHAHEISEDEYFNFLDSAATGKSR